MSLLGQLGIKQRLGWRDTNIFPGVNLEGALVETCSLVMLAGDRYVPACDGYAVSADAPRVGFERWWQQTVAVDPEVPARFSRRDIVLAIANKDGGAHVDPKPLSVAYTKLARSNFLRFERVRAPAGRLPGPDDPGEPLAGSVALAAMRQIADEMLATLTDPTVRPRLLDEPGRNEPCPCGSGAKYKRCHGS